MLAIERIVCLGLVTVNSSRVVSRRFYRENNIGGLNKLGDDGEGLVTP